MDSATGVQLLDEADVISQKHKYPWERHESSYCPSCDRSIAEQTVFFSFDEAASLEKGKLWIHTCKPRLKIDPVSHMQWDW